MHHILSLFKRQEGAIAIEAAFIMLAFSMIAIATADFAAITTSTVELGNAVRVGQHYALSYPGDSSGISRAIMYGSTLPSTKVSTSVTTFCECDQMTSVCGAKCTGITATYTSITGNYDVPLLFSYPGLGSGSYSISKTIKVRTQ